MEFQTVLFLVVMLTLPVAAVLFAGAFGLLDDLGRGGLATEDLLPPPPPQSPAGRLEREEEIRQLVQARSDRQVARGRPGLDVEEEVRRLLDIAPEGASGPTGDAALREEVRQLVVARNERRLARGEPPLDVGTEIDRQLRDAGA